MSNRLRLSHFTSLRSKLRACNCHWTARSIAAKKMIYCTFKVGHELVGTSEKSGLYATVSLRYFKPSTHCAAQNINNAHFIHKHVVKCLSLPPIVVDVDLLFGRVSKFTHGSRFDSSKDKDYCHKHLWNNTQHHLRSRIVFEVGILDED